MRRPGMGCLICVLMAVVTRGGGSVMAQTAPTATATPTPTKFDACALIQKKEIEALQGSIKDTKGSERVDGDFRVAQCFYTAADFSRSVNLTVFQKHPTDPSRRGSIEFWKHTFGRYAEKKEGEHEEKEAKEPREKEEGAPPRRIERLGDDAYWVPNRFGGTLYVLKGEAIMSISIGGPDSEEVKIDKSKKLAAKALRRI
jgi:hypothetical protein